MPGERSLDAARARFLRGGCSLLSAGEVSPAVLASWERSVAAAVDVERLRASFVGHGDVSSVVGAAESVLDDAARDAAGTPCALGLVDTDGVVRARRDLDDSLGELLDAARWTPGYRHAESVVGTTAAAIALHEATAVEVAGAEHLHPELRWMRESAAPVIGEDGRPVAALVVVSHAGEGGLGLLALARVLARQVAERDRVDRHREVVAVQEVMRVAEADGAPWVVATVGGQMWSGRGVRTLTPSDQQSLQDMLTASALLDQTGTRLHVDLPSGGCGEVVIREVLTGDRPAGCVLVGTPTDEHARTADVEARRRQGAHVAPTARRDYAAGLPGRTGDDGRSEEARLRASRELFSPYGRARQEVTANFGQRRHQVLLGESGVGKRTLAVERFRSLHPSGTTSTVDCSTLDRRRHAVARATADPGSPAHLVLLCHLQTLTPVTARLLDDALRDVWSRPGRVVVVGCVDTPSIDATRPYGLLLRQFHDTVQVPALRQRTDELAEIAQEVLRAHNGGRSLRLSHQVVRVLEGYAWPGNISELEDVVRYVVARKPVGVIQAPDLPALCFTSRAPRLTMLETAQADAIIQALYEAGGNRYKAAAMLGIARSSLYRKIDAFGISYIA